MTVATAANVRSVFGGFIVNLNFLMRGKLAVCLFKDGEISVGKA